MQHVDEGRLHAWLDGELPPAGSEGARALERHLDECAACRARAAEERRIRDDASSILRRADPVEQPAPGVIPFPAPAPARRTARPWVALGWAASVLIALGIGWMARPEPDSPVAINQPSRPSAPAADAAEPGTVDGRDYQLSRALDLLRGIALYEGRGNPPGGPAAAANNRG